REVRRRDRGESRDVRALRGADAVGLRRAQPVHRLRRRRRDREGGGLFGPLAARGRSGARGRGRHSRPGARLSSDDEAAPVTRRRDLAGYGSVSPRGCARFAAAPAGFWSVTTKGEVMKRLSGVFAPALAAVLVIAGGSSAQSADNTYDVTTLAGKVASLNG